jgi:hypothetical protein
VAGMTAIAVADTRARAILKLPGQQFEQPRRRDRIFFNSHAERLKRALDRRDDRAGRGTQLDSPTPLTPPVD